MRGDACAIKTSVRRNKGVSSESDGGRCKAEAGARPAALRSARQGAGSRGRYLPLE